MFKYIGLPTPQTFHKKFLLHTQANDFEVITPSTIKKEVFHAEETFLVSTKGKTEALVRKVGKNDSYIYNHEVRLYENNQRILKKRQISAREYIDMLD